MSTSPTIDTTVYSLKTAFEKSFGSRVTCLIHHGSSLYKDIDNEFSDIDLELVLIKYKKNDIQLIKKIVNSSSIKIECQFRYLSELTDSQGLITNTNYKTFMYFAYSNGICLLGKNVYQDLVNKLSDNEVKKSFLVSAQIEFKNIRKAYLSGASPMVVNKHIATFLLDILMFLGELNYRDLGKEIIFQKAKILFKDEIVTAFSKLMTIRDYKIYQNFIDDYNKYHNNQEIFLLINKIANFLLKNEFDK